MLTAIDPPAAPYLFGGGSEWSLSRRCRAVGFGERLGKNGTVLDYFFVDAGAALLMFVALRGRHLQIISHLASPQHGGAMHIESQGRSTAPAAKFR